MLFRVQLGGDYRQRQNLLPFPLIDGLVAVFRGCARLEQNPQASSTSRKEDEWPWITGILYLLSAMCGSYSFHTVQNGAASLAYMRARYTNRVTY
jgi:hypothetical protein